MNSSSVLAEQERSASPSISQCARSGAVGLGQTRAVWTDRGLGCVRRGGSIGIVPLGLEQLLESYAEGKLCVGARAAHPAATRSLIRVGSVPSVSDGDGGKGGSVQACARQIRSWIIHVAPKALDTLLGSAGRTIRSAWHTLVCCTGRTGSTQGSTGIQELYFRAGQAQSPALLSSTAWLSQAGSS